MVDAEEIEDTMNLVCESFSGGVSGCAAASTWLADVSGRPPAPAYPADPIDDSFLPPTLSSSPLRPSSSAWTATVHAECDEAATNLLRALLAWSCAKNRVVEALASFMSRLSGRQVYVSGSASYF